MADKPWGGRFTETTDTVMEMFNASVDFDKRFYRVDIEGSVAHVRMMAKVGVFGNAEADEMVRGLGEILREIESGDFKFDTALEDIHMNIEKRLVDKIGDVGKKLHTGRSRNDQVALDFRLYLKGETRVIMKSMAQFSLLLVKLADKHRETVLPGYTHLQRAQPVLLAHHLLAYYNMIKRDFYRFCDCGKRMDKMPLGSGALAGNNYPIDREFLSIVMGFSGPTENSLDAVSDRDFALEFLSAASITMMHFSRISEEFILWASEEFGYIEISDKFCTGSSLMPQKKNPDALELIRGKCGRVYGNLVGLLTVMKGLPLAYNKDMQEDKEGVFDTIDTLSICLEVLLRMLPEVDFKKDVMHAKASEGFSMATDIADYLTKKGLPFRDCHEVTGKIVADCISASKGFSDITLAEYKEYSELFEEDVFDILSVESSVRSKNAIGGTGYERVSEAVKESYREVEEMISHLEDF